jgi:hypothetical protein
VKAIALHGLFRVLQAVKVVLVALVCLVIGFSARQLFDAYGKEMIPFLKKARTETELQVIVTTPETIPLTQQGVDLPWSDGT